MLIIIGASLSEPHTSELNGETFCLSVCMYISYDPVFVLNNFYFTVIFKSARRNCNSTL